MPLQESACVQRGAGREVGARAAYAALVDLLRAKPYMNATVAAVASALGEREDAIRLLETAARHHEPGLFYVPMDPRFDLLRGDPASRRSTGKSPRGSPSGGAGSRG